MSVYSKLSKARVALHSMDLKKSGINKFSNYRYFELGDFLPQTLKIFNDIGLCGIVSFGKETSKLTIVDVENPADFIVIETPTGSASLKGCHDIQNLGAVQTYTRRYLWSAAMEMVEHDALDGGEYGEPQQPVNQHNQTDNSNKQVSQQFNLQNFDISGVVEEFSKAQTAKELADLWKPVPQTAKQQLLSTYKSNWTSLMEAIAMSGTDALKNAWKLCPIQDQFPAPIRDGWKKIADSASKAPPVPNQ